VALPARGALPNWLPATMLLPPFLCHRFPAPLPLRPTLGLGRDCVLLTRDARAAPATPSSFTPELVRAAPRLYCTALPFFGAYRRSDRRGRDTFLLAPTRLAIDLASSRKAAYPSLFTRHSLPALARCRFPTPFYLRLHPAPSDTARHFAVDPTAHAYTVAGSRNALWTANYLLGLPSDVACDTFTYRRDGLAVWACGPPAFALLTHGDITLC